MSDVGRVAVSPSVVLACLAAAGTRLRVAADRPERVRGADLDQRRRARRSSPTTRPAGRSTSSSGARSTRCPRWPTGTRSSSTSTTRAAGASTARRTGRPSADRAARTPGPCFPTSSPPATRRTARTGRRRAGRSRCPTSATRRGTPRAARTGSRSRTGRGEVAKLETGMDWVYNGRFQDLFGRYTYNGTPVYGFGTTRYGAPTDGFGALIYLDTYNSVYGPGWRRENSFVSHNPTGAFCYGFYPFDPNKGGYAHPPGETALRGPGVGEKYRLFAERPGRDAGRRRHRAGAAQVRPAQPGGRSARAAAVGDPRRLRRPQLPRGPVALAEQLAAAAARTPAPSARPRDGNRRTPVRRADGSAPRARRAPRRRTAARAAAGTGTAPSPSRSLTRTAPASASRGSTPSHDGCSRSKAMRSDGSSEPSISSSTPSSRAFFIDTRTGPSRSPSTRTRDANSSSARSRWPGSFGANSNPSGACSAQRRNCSSAGSR